MVVCSTGDFCEGFDDLSNLFGRLFQVRDDYQNLVSADVMQPSFVFSCFPSLTKMPLVYSTQRKKGFAKISMKANTRFL